MLVLNSNKLKPNSKIVHSLSHYLCYSSDLVTNKIVQILSCLLPTFKKFGLHVSVEEQADHRISPHHTSRPRISPHAWENFSQIHDVHNFMPLWQLKLYTSHTFTIASADAVVILNPEDHFDGLRTFYYLRFSHRKIFFVANEHLCFW